MEKGDNALAKATNHYYSLGFRLMDEGAAVIDVVPGTPADAAGITPGSNLIAVNGRKYSKDVLNDALNSGGDASRSIQLLMQKDEMFTTAELHYAGHARHPKLERDASTADLLTAILSARTP